MHLRQLDRLVSIQSGKEQIRAIHTVAISPETKPFLDYIGQSLEDLRKKGDFLNGFELQWNQGACQALQEILDSPGTAKTFLKKLRG